MITYVCELLQVIGARDPYPVKMSRRNRPDTSSAWWSQFQPITEDEIKDSRENFKRRKMFDINDINDINNDLSIFDAKKVIVLYFIILIVILILILPLIAIIWFKYFM